MRARISENPAAAARWVEAAALAGIVNAQIAWGQMLVDGRGVARDPAAGLRWFQLAAAAGSTDGINMVGRCHELGWGAPIDPTRAAALYRQAAERGHGWAQFNLATLLLDGRGVAADRIQALHWYVRAARNGEADVAAKAATMIGRSLELGWERPARPAAALRWYRRGAEGGDYRGQFDYARLLLERSGRVDLAAPWFARCIEVGVPAFCRHVGVALRQAPHPELRRLALRALERATLSGEPADLRVLGGALAEGLGGKPDPQGSAVAFRRAREAEARRMTDEAALAASPAPLPDRIPPVGRRVQTPLSALGRLFGLSLSRRRPITNKS
ncbi:tetratricopeptide repeat protein [Ancylobacter sp. FA202]|uniref:tetratricopeptide repeat protein n=1 Tax=Ancylobacter sp. FA202 TaxID=1111106 RepID=UPI000399BE9A|nr:tetratricopeptide repeat protein [Ancylobacter sp. FA202]